MDFTLVSLESLVGPTHPESSSGAPYEGISEARPPNGILGSGFVKQQRRGLEGDEWRSSKVSKTVDLSSSSVNEAMQFSQGITNGSPLLGSNPLLFSGLHDNYAPQQQQQQQQQQEYMLSFSSQKPETLPFWGKDGGALAFPYYQRMPTIYSRNAGIYSRNAGYGSGSLNASMHVPYAGIRGPFTPSQWIELEHQALIYKYLTSNVPVPSNLLIPLKKSLNPYALSGSSSSPLPPKSWWGSFHLGYGDNTDPEPGRCRRTDGKKWRCSRDAVADQKYCERHINRGRHRSRKPVEGQTGHAASRAATTSKVVLPMTSSDSTVMSSAMPIGGASNSLTTITQSGAAAAVANPSTDAAVVNRIQDLRGLSGMSSSSTVNLKSNDTGFNIPRQEFVTEGSSHSEFGLVSTDSLLNPSQESSYIDTKNYDTSSFLDFSGQEAQDQLPLHHFIDDWPKDDSDQSVIAWPEDMKSDWINLSMSLPMTSSDFSSSSNSPKHEKLALSPLRLFHEFEPEQVNLGPTDELGEAAAAGGPKQTNWVPPISWGGSSCSMGGPLGEVLTNTSGGNAKASYKNNPSSSLNLLTEGWDGLSPQVGSSPTGVLQKSTFCSLSNSSSESSPRATGHHNKNINSDEASIYDDVLGSTLAASSVPTL